MFILIAAENKGSVTYLSWIAHSVSSIISSLSTNDKTCEKFSLASAVKCASSLTLPLWCTVHFPPSFCLTSPQSLRESTHMCSTRWLSHELASSPRSLTKVKLMVIVAKVTVLCSLSQLQPSVKSWLYCKWLIKKKKALWENSWHINRIIGTCSMMIKNILALV